MEGIKVRITLLRRKLWKLRFEEEEFMEVREVIFYFVNY
jgi:hypothetical protein